MATVLTEWENHKYQTEHEDALIKKIYLFQTANNYLNLFFIALLKGGDFVVVIFGRPMDCIAQEVSCDVNDEDEAGLCDETTYGHTQSAVACD